MRDFVQDPSFKKSEDCIIQVWNSRLYKTWEPLYSQGESIKEVYFLTFLQPYHNVAATPTPLTPKSKRSINLYCVLATKLTFSSSFWALFFSSQSQHIFCQGEAERLSLYALLHAQHHRAAIAQRAMQRKLSCRETPRPAQPLGCKKRDRPSCSR